MKTSLLNLLQEQLLDKKIKLYIVEETKRDNTKLIYYVSDKCELNHPKMCKVTGETYGFIKKFDAEHDNYEGDSYFVEVVDEKGNIIHFNGLFSITSGLEILN